MKWLFALFSLLIVAVVGLAVAPSFFDWNKYKDPALKQVADLTGYDVSIGGDISLALLPSPRVYLENVSVKDPSDQKGEAVLAAFDLLDVRVGLLPLFQGQAAVQTVRLEKPQVAIIKDKDGRFNFMTDKVERLMNGKKALDQGQGTAPTSDEKKVALSFENIEIEDGTFAYRDLAAKEPILVEKLNLDLEASSIEGPFEGEGSFTFNGQPVEFEGKTGAVDLALQSTSLNLDARYGAIALKYAGVVAGGEAPEVQGEAAVSVSSLSELGASAPTGLDGKLSMKGLLTANTKAASFKNATIQVGDKTLSGSIDASMEPLSAKGTFTGADIIDLDPFLKTGAKKDSKGFDPASLGAALPKTLEIPALGTIDVSLAVPGVIYNGQVLKDVSFSLQNTDKTFAGVLDIGNAPGQGLIQAKGALSYAEKSRSAKTGKDIYSDPMAVFDVKGQTQNLPLMVQALSGLTDLPLVKDSKRGVFDVNGRVSPLGVSIEKGVINLDDAAFSVSGSWKGQTNSSRSLLKASVVADQLDFDALTGGSSAPNGGDPLQPLKTLALPYDVDADITVNNAVLQGHKITGLKAGAVIVPNQLKLKSVSADDFVGSKIQVSGTVGDLKNLAGLDIAANVNTPDPYKLASAFKVDTSTWPQGLGSTKANVKAKGSISALDVDASVEAFGGEVGVLGKVSNPLTELSLSGLSVRVSHPNMAKAIQSFAPGSPNYASLAKPMSVKANLSMNGKVTSLSNIEGSLAGASVSGAAKIDTGGSKPDIAGTLRFGDLVLVSGKSGSPAGQKSAGGSSSSGGKWSTAAMDSGWLHSMNANLDIAANSILYETWDLKKPALKMTIQNGVMTLQDLQAGLYDGQISSSGTVSSSSPSAPMSVKMASSISNINMGALAKALAGSRRIQAEGDVSLKFDVAGSGASQSALVSSLNGSANLNGTNVIMKGFDLAGLAGALMESSKPLPRVQQILKASTSGGETAFDTVTGQYAIQNGVVNISSMQLDGPSALIVSKGAASLPRWSLDTTHTVTLKNANEVEPFDVVIKGPLDNPSNTFGSGLFDTFVRQRLQQKVAEELPGLLGDDVADKLQKFGILPQKQKSGQPAETEPASGVGGEQAPAQAPATNDNAPAQPKPEDVVNDLLKGFLQ